MCTGSYHELSSGERIPISLVNNTGPDFSIPSAYKAAELPLGAAKTAVYDPVTAHFLSLCMKLVYEDPVVIQVSHSKKNQTRIDRASNYQNLNL